MFFLTENNNGEILQGPSGKRNRGYTVKTKPHHWNLRATVHQSLHRRCG